MVNTKNVLNNVKKWIESIEQSKTPFIFFVLTFLFAVTMRNYFETFSDFPAANLQYYTIANIIEYYIWYLGLAILITLLLYLATKEKIKHIFHLTLPTFLALNIAPLVDIILSGGKGFRYAYMIPGVHEDLIIRWLTFTGEYVGLGPTPGMAIEAIVILFVAFFYLYLKTNKILTSMFYTFIIYSIVFWWGTIPFANKALLQSFNISYQPSALFTIQFILVFLSPALFIMLYVYNKTHFKQFFKKVSAFSPIHYLFILLFGSALALNLFPSGLQFTQGNFFQWILASIAILCTMLFLNSVKQLSEPVDKNGITPHHNDEKIMTININKKYAIIFFAASILYATAADHITVFSILTVMSCLFIYQAPPFNLQKIPFISKIFISLSTIVILYLGYYYITGFYQLFPPLIIVFFLFPFTAALNVIDLEKETINKETKIYSVVTILGMNKAKIVISFFITLTYLILGLILQHTMITILLVGFGILESCFIFYRKQYSQTIVYSLYSISLIILIYFISTTPLSF